MKQLLLILGGCLIANAIHPAALSTGWVDIPDKKHAQEWEILPRAGLPLCGNGKALKASVQEKHARMRTAHEEAFGKFCDYLKKLQTREIIHKDGRSYERFTDTPVPGTTLPVMQNGPITHVREVIRVCRDLRPEQLIFDTDRGKILIAVCRSDSSQPRFPQLKPRVLND